MSSNLRACLALLLGAALLPACGADGPTRGGRGSGGSSDTGVAGDTLVDTSDDSTGGDASGSGDTLDDTTVPDTSPPDTGQDSGADTAGDVAEDVEGDTVPSRCDSTADCAAGACLDGLCVVQCTAAADCDGTARCERGLCVPVQCLQSSQCDDFNPCTEDSCVGDRCSNVGIAPPLADVLVGDCLGRQCQGGEPVPVPLDSDLPADDGISCTVEACRAGVPVFEPSDRLCDDGLAANGTEVCSVVDGGCVTAGGGLCEPPPAVTPRPELCDDLDNNGNGRVDEGCSCSFGMAKPCYGGAVAQRGLGSCIDGYQVCSGITAPAWGECVTDAAPAAEACDGADNDCDGCPDDGLDCGTAPVCPSYDLASVLSDYVPGSLFTRLPIATATWTVSGGLAEPATGTGAGFATRFKTPGRRTVAGNLTFTDGSSANCAWTVDVRPGEGLNVLLTWDTFGVVDLDLHLHRGAAYGDFCATAADCHYANCQPNHRLGWGYLPTPAASCEGTTCPNPRLALDNIRDTDPEWIIHDTPNPGETFRVMVHKFSGTPATQARVEVWCGGSLVSVLGELPDAAALAGAAASGCQGSSWRVADVTIVSQDDGRVECEVTPLVETGSYDIRSNDSTY
jgi:hypothetical protein